MNYTFTWDEAKAQGNRKKHGVRFEEGAEVVLDPLAISITDNEHDEERIVTTGKDRVGRLLILVYTQVDVSAQKANIRIISARKANPRETKEYEENRP